MCLNLKRRRQNIAHVRNGLGNDGNDIHTQIICDKSVDYDVSCCLTLGPPNIVHQCRSKLVKMSNDLDQDETPSYCLFMTL